MRGVEVLDEHERDAAVGRHGSEERLGGREAAGRRADAHHEISLVSVRRGRRRWLCPLLLPVPLVARRHADLSPISLLRVNSAPDARVSVAEVGAGR